MELTNTQIQLNDLKKQLNYTLSVYNKKNELIEKLEGPGDIGKWWPGNESPMTAAIFFIDDKSVSKTLKDRKIFYLPASRTPLNCTECKEYGFAILEEDMETIEELASELNVNFYYWFEWDGALFISINSTGDYIDIEYATEVSFSSDEKECGGLNLKF